MALREKLPANVMTALGDFCTFHELRFAPLMKIGLLYIDEASDSAIPRADLSPAATAIGRLITGACSYAEAVEVCLRNLRTAEPAHRINRILSIARGGATGAPPMPRTLCRRSRIWTDDHDVRLLAGIHRFGLGNWKPIANFVGIGKSSSQCSQRWSRALNPSLRKEQWTAAEDEDLWELVRRNGTHNWAQIAKQMRSRSDVQCRYRFERLVRTGIFGEFTPVAPPLKLVENPFDGQVAELVPPLVIRSLPY
jgi:hypothetical protein